MCVKLSVCFLALQKQQDQKCLEKIFELQKTLWSCKSAFKYLGFVIDDHTC